MKLQVQLEVKTHGGESPLIEDIERALTDQLHCLMLSWNDPSLGRVLSAGVTVLHISESPK